MTTQPALSVGYGEDVFKGAIADKYLKANGLKLADLEDYSWIKLTGVPCVIPRSDDLTPLCPGTV